jgi:hypothetical protein
VSWRTSWLALALIALACGGVADDPAEHNDPGDAGAPREAEQERSAVPPCEGEAVPSPDACQRLVYSPAEGYCNRWVPCSDVRGAASDTPTSLAAEPLLSER